MITLLLVLKITLLTFTLVVGSFVVQTLLNKPLNITYNKVIDYDGKDFYYHNWTGEFNVVGDNLIHTTPDTPPLVYDIATQTKNKIYVINDFGETLIYMFEGNQLIVRNLSFPDEKLVFVQQ